jgi:hypothetical protein
METLSDKIFDSETENNCLLEVEDVKEFIKQLKEDIAYRKSRGQKASFNILLLVIDKLAGEKLI